MSQQTTLVVVLPRFILFTKTLPNIQSLANCSDDVLRGLWKGLGYYARARNLKKGAQYIINRWGDYFPSTFDDWLSIPGCGEYTAAMVASICFGQKIAAVDGNVTRVAARVLGLGSETWEKSGKKRIHEFAQNLVRDSENAGDCNQALIELGALICRKQNPDCLQCPLQPNCVAFREKRTTECPPSKPRRAFENHTLFPIVLCKENRYALFSRSKGFLKGTRGFPLLGTLNPLQELQPGTKHLPGSEFAHTITHHRLSVQPTIVPIGSSSSKSKLDSGLASFFKKHGATEMIWLTENEMEQALQTSLDAKTWNIVKTLT